MIFLIWLPKQQKYLISSVLLLPLNRLTKLIIAHKSEVKNALDLGEQMRE